MKKKYLCAFLSTVIYISMPLHAAITPTSQQFDERVTQVNYNASDVINIRTQIGISTLIQLQVGENVNASNGGIGIGDGKAWGISTKGNNIFIKPMAIQPDTNLLITTNKDRTYAFKLTISKLPHYIVKLVYKKPQTIKNIRTDTNIPCYDGKVNFAYGKWGDNELSPAYMWDDGRFTCLKFTKNTQLPVPYQVASDGSESLINYHIENDTMILHSISSEFRLRLGKRVLGLRSDDAVFAGFNNKGTTIKARRALVNE